MRQLSIILLFGCFSVFSGVEIVRGQATAGGTVINAKTGEPLEGAHVYLSGTKIGTATAANGRYSLRNIPAGGHRVVVSMIGYTTQITDLIISPGANKEIDFELKPAVYELPEIYVGDLDKKWKKNLDRFKRNFIGETAWADSVKIHNPEVLRFDNNWWGRLTAEALAPLKIENRALGYYITYHLKEFEHNGTRTRWDGEPLFTEMTPDNSTQAAYWAKNRKTAFYGSLRHFLLALLADRVKEEGFVIYNLQEGAFRFTSGNRSRISARQIIEDGDESFLYELNFFGRLEIIYTREAEHIEYVNWRQDEHRYPSNYQTSYLALNEHPVTVDNDGEFIQPYGATQYGYFAFSLLADATPREYRPEDYQETKN
ncbi:MAG: carboxypeptidase-like regulatory domain-containing protein [Balneolaceae bacterium]|nr:carboxypeptidase-like regulatory domain-containing protein [Balneolaceae bacterium]